MNCAARLARAIAVVVVATAVVGVARTTSAALHEDCDMHGSVALWAFLFAPLSGALASALLTTMVRPGPSLRQAGLACMGASAGVLLAGVTAYVTLTRVPQESWNCKSDLGALAIALAMGGGGIALLVLLTLVGTILLLVSHGMGKRS
jgi:hypothetical protein